MIWFPTAIMKPQKHKNHMFIDFFNNLISAHFFSIQMTSCHMVVQNGCRDGPLAWGCRRRVDVCQTLTVEGDPLDLLFWTLLLDMILLGT